MGTRADFYVGRGKDSEWIGSIAFDGYPDGEPADAEHGPVIKATTVEQFREFVSRLLMKDTSTTPDQGWPWPWEDSRTTDYTYAFDDGKVWCSPFGHDWFDPLLPEPEESGNVKTAVFPNMKDKQNVTLGPRSGMIVFGIPKQD